MPKGGPTCRQRQAGNCLGQKRHPDALAEFDNDEEHGEDGGFDEDENTDEVKDDQDDLKGKRRAGR